MKVLFIFFLRLFFCLVAAKLILRGLGSDNRTYLIALTLLFTGNLYWFDFLEYRDRIAFHLQKMKKSAPQGTGAEEVPAPEPPGESLEKD